MPYATLDELRGPTGVLDQLSEDVDRDALLTAILDDASAFIDNELGASLTAAVIGTRTVYGDGTVWLSLPLFVPGSVTLVATLSGYSIPSYVEADGTLRVTDDLGVYTDSPYPALYPYSSSYLVTGTVWLPGVPYTVSATYGVSANDMHTARRICLELAVQLFRFKDAGGSQQVGTEAGVINVKNSYSPLIQAQLGHLRQKVQPASVGVW